MEYHYFLEYGDSHLSHVSSIMYARLLLLVSLLISAQSRVSTSYHTSSMPPNHRGPRSRPDTAKSTTETVDLYGPSIQIIRTILVSHTLVQY